MLWKLDVAHGVDFRRWSKVKMFLRVETLLERLGWLHRDDRRHLALQLEEWWITIHFNIGRELFLVTDTCDTQGMRQMLS